MVFVPTTYQLVKGLLLGLVLCFIVAATLLRQRIDLSSDVVLWTLFLVSTGLFFMSIGAASGAPGALRVGTVYVAWPIVYLLLISAASNATVLRDMFRLLVLGTVIISIYSATFVLHAAGILPDVYYIEIDQGQAIGLREGTVEFNLYSISSLLFLVPYSLAALVTWPSGLVGKYTKGCLWLGVALGVAVTLVSGRRALLLCLSLAPLITIIFWCLADRAGRQVTMGHIAKMYCLFAVLSVGAFSILGTALGLDPVEMTREFASGFDFAWDPSASVRREQFVALLEEWTHRPIFGYGHGAAATSIIRSVEYPWAYELSYVALLFHTGIVGVAFYAAGIFWIYWNAMKLMRSTHYLAPYMLPVLVGTTCFLIANATNPYLEKFDYLWVIFLPVAVINVWLIEKGPQAVGRKTFHCGKPICR